MRAPPVVCVFGISGVGKTTLIQAALKDVPGGLHLEASALIKQGLADPAMDSDQLRQAGGERVLANQQILVTMFQRSAGMRPASVVVFDGHLVIDVEERLVEIPEDVIAALGPRMLVHVEDDPALISRRRKGDPSRSRAQRSAEALSLHQHASRRLCAKYGIALDVPTITLGPHAARQLAEVLLTFYSGRR